MDRGDIGVVLLLLVGGALTAIAVAVVWNFLKSERGIADQAQGSEETEAVATDPVGLASKDSDRKD